MGTVHRLSVVLQGESGRHLTDEFATLVDKGEVFGPRLHQIEVLRQSIRKTLRELPAALESSAEKLPVDHPTRRSAEDAVKRFIQEVEGLVTMVEPNFGAQAYVGHCRNTARAK